MTCRVRGGCKEPALLRQTMCRKHWMMVPWQLRRRISKLYSQSDGLTDRAYDWAAAEALATVNKQLMAAARPPLPEDPWR